MTHDRSRYFSMRRGAPLPATTAAPLGVADVAAFLSFSPADGRIWLDDQRMVLMRSSSLGVLRRELIDAIGRDRARSVLTRAGHESGARDAQFVRDRWPNVDLTSSLLAGLFLHALEGVVKVEPIELEIDLDRGTYHGEFLWHHSSEDDEHVRLYGLGNEPACWSQLGYATGFVTTLMCRPVLFREVECRAMGNSCCRVIGKSAELWGDVSDASNDWRDPEPVVSLPAATPGKTHAIVSAAPAGRRDRAMIGVSAAFQSACQLLDRVAPTQATVLITGDSGVGKEAFASALHEKSPRSRGPFVAVNCGAIPATLIESELFGVERGAFTGATMSRAGRFERAANGTLFLDEIANLDLAAQGALLRALQEGSIERVGGSTSISVDVRVVAATNVDLEQAVEAGRFRQDLFFRLNVFPIHLPPLRERREDIPLLMEHFLERFKRIHSRAVRGFSVRALKVFLSYDFPGNIRELSNLVERGVISVEEGGLIDVPHIFRRERLSEEATFSLGAGGRLARGLGEALPAPLSGLLERLGGTSSEPISLDAIEQQLITEAVARSKGNLASAARSLGLTRPQLAYRLKSARANEASRQPTKIDTPRE
jgi:two-component system, NtrC family, response regulator HydG